MTRVAVIGANGQVGAELCLLLAREPGIELVAVCRNRSGSAFLRWQGIACRHGRIADSHDAKRLIGDCDIVVNSALATGSPAEIRHTEARIIENLFGYSKGNAKIIHFSTQSVYGDARPGRWWRRRNPYGRAKLASEGRFRAHQSRTQKPGYILRLGHVCGALQEISLSIRDEIRSGTVVLPATDWSSNTVYTIAIVGAILQIARGGAAAGTYDLMNSPRWSWREVYEFEARQCGLALNPTFAAPATHPARSGWFLTRVLRWLVKPLSNALVVELGTKLFAYAPERLNARAMAWWFTKRARREIALLSNDAVAHEHLSWVQNGVRFFPAETPTAVLLGSIDSRPIVNQGVARWAADLPDAEPEGEGVASAAI